MAIRYPTSLANLLAEVGTRHCHQILLGAANIEVSQYNMISKHHFFQWSSQNHCKIFYYVTIALLCLKLKHQDSSDLMLRLATIVFLDKGQRGGGVEVFGDGCRWGGRATLQTRWRHQMETFSELLAICAGNSPVTGTQYLKVTTSMVSGQKGPTRHAYAWQIGPFWQDTLDICSVISTTLFRALENLYSFYPYILAKLMEMSYIDPYFSSKVSKMYSFDPPFFTRVAFRVDGRCWASLSETWPSFDIYSHTFSR